jgi:bifunctional ADP-heptose synthase (sugar kinase/adenylyltransferase)
LTLDKSRSVYHEMRVLESYGGKMHFTSGETFSSTKLSHFLLSAPEASQRDPLLRNEKVLFKDLANHAFKLEQLKQFLAAAARLRVAVIGETIIDEWVDVSLTTLSTQSRCVAGLETARVRQVGGLGIIAQHLAHFVASVDCYTNHIESTMPSNVMVNTVATGRVVETRFVDRDTGHAVFKTRNRTLGSISLDPLPEFDNYDLVLIADFGHGMLDAAAINRKIAAHKRAVVGVMAQVNSGNYGYNLPLKYTGADYYALNRIEAELCVHERDLPLPALLERASQVLNASAIAVTDGPQGAIVQSGGVRFQLPSLTVSVVDTIGCGDAFFALSGAALAAGFPANMVTLAGSIGAAAMTQRRCNESPVTETEFLTIGKIVI